MSYSFYCSKCKIDHAGECPPAVSSKTPAYGMPRGTGLPPIGSLWRPWVTEMNPPYPYIETPFRYEVVGVAPNGKIQYTDTSDASRRVYEMDPAAWTAAGADLVDPTAIPSGPVPRVRFAVAYPTDHAYRMSPPSNVLTVPYDCVNCGHHEEVPLFVGGMSPTGQWSPATPQLGPCPAVKP